jgi:hypothetical protein
MRQETLNHPHCEVCNQFHQGDYRVTPGRCFVCRQEGHRWKECIYVTKGCHLYGENGHYHRNCLNRGQARSQQQSIIVDVSKKEPMQHTQSGISANRGRGRSTRNKTQGRVYHITQEDVRAASDVVAGMITLNA